ncbi:MAG: tetratricopeptide repeat protein, partial [Vicinamibacterales bacterium]
MRCIPIALLLAALASACTSADSRQRRLYDAAQDDVWQGAATRALERIQKGEAVAGAPASQWGWRFRLLRTEALLLRRDTAAALTLLNGLPPLERPDPALAARRGYLRALAQTYQGQLSEAAATLEEARQQAHAAPADGVLLDIDALQGQLHLRAGRLRDADALLQDLLARASARGDAYHQAVALHNLGNGRITRNRFDEALVFFERILELKELEQYIIYGTALIGAGISYARLGQFDRAVSVQRRSIESHEKRDPPTYLGLALGELGNTYVLHEEQRRGLDYLARALKVATAAGAASEAAIWAGNLAKVAIDLGNFDEAERFNREAIRLKTRTRGSTLYNTFYSARIASGRGQLADAKRLYQETLEGSEGQPGVRWETLDGLARVALAAGDRRTAARHFGAALDTIQQTRSDLLKTEYRLTFLSRVIRFYQDYVDTLVATGDTTRALEVADSSRAVVLAERMGGSATTQAASVESFVAAAKRTGSVWLTYWLAPERSYVWVVTGNGIRCVPLPGASAIEQLVKDYRAMVQRTATDPLTSPGSAGDALYAMVVAPVARFIPPGSPVRIVADGALHGINFETLPVDGPRRHYWIE